MSGPINRIMFKGVLMTVSEIATQHALNVSTVLRRLRVKPRLTDDQLVAAPFSLPRSVLAGQNRAMVSERDMTVGEAAYHLRRAQQVQERHGEHYRNAIKWREPPAVQHRLKMAADKAEANVMYWKERVRMLRDVSSREEKVPIKVPGRRGWVEPETRKFIKDHEDMHALVRYLNEPGEMVSPGVTLIED